MLPVWPHFPVISKLFCLRAAYGLLLVTKNTFDTFKTFTSDVSSWNADLMAFFFIWLSTQLSPPQRILSWHLFTKSLALLGCVSFLLPYYSFLHSSYHCLTWCCFFCFYPQQEYKLHEGRDLVMFVHPWSLMCSDCFLCIWCGIGAFMHFSIFMYSIKT